MILDSPVLTPRNSLLVRLGVGLLFGLAIAALLHGFTPPDHLQGGLSGWPLVRTVLVSSLGLLAFVLWAGSGVMRRNSLALWALAAWALLVAIAVHESSRLGHSAWQAHGLLVLPLLFIAHELVSSADLAGRPLAAYAVYFDEAWKRGIQLALAVLFTALFWGILWLGSTLLTFIGFDWLKQVLMSPWFSWPATGVAMGASVHLGDIQTRLLIGVRALVLGVLAWLLPVITVIGAIFVVSLMVSGLAPLWATKAAGVTLLSVCIGFVLLINAAYQQGDQERSVHPAMKLSVRLAAVLLSIFAGLAAWSLYLRIGQYGLTPDRVMAGMVTLISLLFGVGYSAAVVWRGRWMARIEPVNVTMAFVKCALFIAVLTPLASPARLSVADQVSRLTHGKVKPDRFDWWLLADESGVYGQRALEGLAQNPDPAIRSWAAKARDGKLGSRYDTVIEQDPGDRPDLGKLPVVFPKGGRLPDSLIRQGLAPTDPFLPLCMTSRKAKMACKAAVMDLNADGTAEVLVLADSLLTILEFKDQRWQVIDTSINLDKDQIRDFGAGKLGLAPSPWQDLVVGGTRKRLGNMLLPRGF